MESLVLQDLQVHLDRLDLLDLLVKLEQLGPYAQLGRQEDRDHQARQECQDLLVRLDHRDHRDHRANQVSCHRGSISLLILVLDQNYDVTCNVHDGTGITQITCTVEHPAVLGGPNVGECTTNTGWELSYSTTTRGFWMPDF